jgi:hypothetical protein
VAGPLLLVLGDSLAFHGPDRAEPADDPRLWPNVAAARLGGRAELVAGIGWTARHAWHAITHDPRVWTLFPHVDALVLAVGGMDTLPSPLPTALRELIPALRPDPLRRAVRSGYRRAQPHLARAFAAAVPGGGPVALPPHLTVRYLELCRGAVLTIRPGVPVVAVLPPVHRADAYGGVHPDAPPPSAPPGPGPPGPGSTCWTCARSSASTSSPGTEPRRHALGLVGPPHRRTSVRRRAGPAAVGSPLVPAPVCVVTDSTASLPPGVAAGRGIRVVPLEVRLGERVGREGVDVDTAAVTAALADPRVDVQTSRPAPAHFAACYRAALAEGAESVVSVHLSRELSGTWDAARLAAEEVGRTACASVDSRAAAMGLGFAVLAAADAADAGLSGAEVEAAAATSPRAAGCSSPSTPSTGCAAAAASAPRPRCWARRWP